MDMEFAQFHPSVRGILASGRRRGDREGLRNRNGERLRSKDIPPLYTNPPTPKKKGWQYTQGGDAGSPAGGSRRAGHSRRRVLRADQGEGTRPSIEEAGQEHQPKQYLMTLTLPRSRWKLVLRPTT